MHLVLEFIQVYSANTFFCSVHDTFCSISTQNNTPPDIILPEGVLTVNIYLIMCECAEPGTIIVFIVSFISNDILFKILAIEATSSTEAVIS